jgi:hypothetical protein
MTQDTIVYPAACACCGDILRTRFDRRRFLHLAAGAGLLAALPSLAFKDWSQAFWDNLAASMQLHHIPKVIAMNHRDCGAAKIAYGTEKVANAQIETETHKAALMEFRKQVAERQPKLTVETGLMALDGKVEIFT